MGRSCRCSALFYKVDSSLWASPALEPPQAVASAAPSVDVQVFADVAVLVVAVAPFDGVQANAVAASLVDAVSSAAVAFGLAHADHPI